jgi:hypothetical protein
MLVSEIITTSLLGGAIMAGTTFVRSTSNMKKKLRDTLVSCKVVTKDQKGVNFPRIVKSKREPFGRRFWVRLPRGFSPKDLIGKLEEDLSVSLCKVVELSEENYQLVVDVVDKFVGKVVQWDYEERHDYKIAWAVDMKGRTKYLDLLNDPPNYLIGGTAGSGKSCFLRVILTTLALRPEEVQPDLYLADLKGGVELSMFSKLSCTKGFVTTLTKMKGTGGRDGLLDMVKKLEKMMRDRLKEMEQNNMVNWNGKKVLFVMDEMIDLLDIKGDGKGNNQRAELRKYIAMLASKGRACGIHMILCTQRPSADIVSGIIKQGMNTKICFRVINDVQSGIVLDNKMASALPLIAGRCVFQQSNEGEVYQTLFLDDKRARKILKGVSHDDIQDTFTEVENNEVEADIDDLESARVHDYVSDSEVS